MKKLLPTGAMLLAFAVPAFATGPDGCARVTNTPDGFLNLRAEPNAKSTVRAKLRPGHLLYADAAECNMNDECEIAGWTHVVTRDQQTGWAATRYLKFIPSRECVRYGFPQSG